MADSNHTDDHDDVDGHDVEFHGTVERATYFDEHATWKFPKHTPPEWDAEFRDTLASYERPYSPLDDYDPSENYPIEDWPNPTPIVIPSHKRAGKITTFRFVTNCLVCVPESQLEEYAQHYSREILIAHPDTVIGIQQKRQWMYERWGDLFILDDDCIGLYRVYREQGAKQRSLCPPNRAYDVIQATCDTARHMGAYLYGFGSHANPITYNPFNPFKFGGYTPGGATGHLREDKLFYPSTTLPVGDYWICLLNAYYHRYAFYDLRYAFAFKQTYTGAGGMAEFRFNATSDVTDDPEIEATRWLRRKFGKCIQVKHVDPRGPTKHNRNRGARTIVLPYKV